jgi:hypothetical protein
MKDLNRRRALQLGISGLAGVAVPAIVRTGACIADPAPQKLSGLLENEDCTDFFYNQEFPAEKAGELVDRYVDVLAGAGVSVLMCNTNARRTNYRSQVWQSFWDGYDPAGPDTQPFLAPVSAEHRARYRKLIGNMLEVHRQGVDYPARVIQRCRQRGIAPWISLRMNDVHENNNLDHPFHSPLWRRPELFRQGHPGYFARALDYAHPEVRDHYRALIVETLQRYDVAGLELDFMREPYLFSKGQEQAGRALLTEWLRGIRALVDDATRRRGHAVRLGVRVPSCPDTALGLGLDAPAWARAGLVDLVVAAPRWATLEFAMPLEKWRRLLGDRVTLAGGLDVNYRPTPASAARLVTPEEARGAAVAVLSTGADMVYLFNYFQHGHPKWPIPQYQRVLKTFSSLAELPNEARRHAITYRDVTVPGEDYRAPLPSRGTQLSFVLPLGPASGPGWQAEVDIEIDNLAGHARPTVSVNGVAGKLRSDAAGTKGRCVLVYTLPETAVRGENRDAIAIAAADNEPVNVHRLEVCLRPRN